MNTKLEAEEKDMIEHDEFPFEGRVKIVFHDLWDSVKRIQHIRRSLVKVGMITEEQRLERMKNDVLILGGS